MISYSQRGLHTRARFYAPYNAITIVVEDTSLERFYTKLLNRLTGDRMRVRTVIGVGGKDQVLRRYEKSTHQLQERVEFYLIDGDFDDLLEVTLPKDYRLYRLPRYDIESFLVDPTAISAIAEEQNPRQSAEHYRCLLNFEQWQIQLVDDIQPLIACYVVLQELKIGSPQGRNIERFVLGSGNLPDTNKIRDFVRQNRSTQDILSEQEFDQKLEAILPKMGKCVRERLRWVSGKDILLPLVVRYLKRETGTNVSLDSLRFRLAGYCDFDDLLELRERLLGVLSA